MDEVELPIREIDTSSIQQQMSRNKESLQVKLMVRRPISQLIEQGILPPLKQSPILYEKTKKLERARTEDYLKHKISNRPNKQELIEHHILEDTNISPILIAKQQQLKRAKLADNLNERLSHRPGPLELIKGNILLPNSLQLEQAIKEGAITFKPTSAGETIKNPVPSFLIIKKDSNQVSSQSNQSQQNLTQQNQTNVMNFQKSINCNNYHYDYHFNYHHDKLRSNSFITNNSCTLIDELENSKKTTDLNLDEENEDSNHTSSSSVFSSSSSSNINEDYNLLNNFFEESNIHKNNNQDFSPQNDQNNCIPVMLNNIYKNSLNSDSMKICSSSKTILEKNSQVTALSASFQKRKSKKSWQIMNTATISNNKLINRKKCKTKAINKNKTIKFHEYKGPPNCVRNNMSNSIPHTETAYELLLQQQQLYLQLELEMQQKLNNQRKETIDKANQINQKISYEQTSDYSLQKHQGLITKSVKSDENISLNEKEINLRIDSMKLEELKVNDLKLKLKKHNLPVSGSKTLLIDRLKNYIRSQNKASSSEKIVKTQEESKVPVSSQDNLLKSSEKNISTKTICTTPVTTFATLLTTVNSSSLLNPSTSFMTTTPNTSILNSQPPIPFTNLDNNSKIQSSSCLANKFYSKQRRTSEPQLQHIQLHFTNPFLQFTTQLPSTSTVQNSNDTQLHFLSTPSLNTNNFHLFTKPTQFIANSNIISNSQDSSNSFSNTLCQVSSPLVSTYSSSSPSLQNTSVLSPNGSTNSSKWTLQQNNSFPQLFLYQTQFANPPQNNLMINLNGESFSTCLKKKNIENKKLDEKLAKNSFRLKLAHQKNNKKYTSSTKNFLSKTSSNSNSSNIVFIEKPPPNYEEATKHNNKKKLLPQTSFLNSNLPNSLNENLSTNFNSCNSCNSCNTCNSCNLSTCIENTCCLKSSNSNNKMISVINQTNNSNDRCNDNYTSMVSCSNLSKESSSNSINLISCANANNNILANTAVDIGKQSQNIQQQQNNNYNHSNKNLTTKTNLKNSFLFLPQNNTNLCENLPSTMLTDSTKDKIEHHFLKNQQSSRELELKEKRTSSETNSLTKNDSIFSNKNESNDLLKNDGTNVNKNDSTDFNLDFDLLMEVPDFADFLDFDQLKNNSNTEKLNTINKPGYKSLTINTSFNCYSTQHVQNSTNNNQMVDISLQTPTLAKENFMQNF